MAIKLNLLPQELAVNKKVASMAKVFRTLNIVALTLLLIFGVGLLVFFLFTSSELRNIQADLSSLESQIRSQEVTEQKIVLLKDRLVKIKSINSIESSRKNLQVMTPVLASLPLDSSLGELSMDTQKIDASFTFRSPTSLSEFFRALSNFDDFSTISLNNFGFNPSAGYLVSLRFVKK